MAVGVDVGRGVQVGHGVGVGPDVRVGVGSPEDERIVTGAAAPLPATEALDAVAFRLA